VKAKIEKQVAEAEKNFDLLNERRAKLIDQGREVQRQVNELDAELLRLQGDYRALKALLEEEPKKEPKKK
jgi:chromosome segregation ATPase